MITHYSAGLIALLLFTPSCSSLSRVAMHSPAMHDKSFPIFTTYQLQHIFYIYYSTLNFINAELI